MPNNLLEALLQENWISKLPQAITPAASIYTSQSAYACQSFEMPLAGLYISFFCIIYNIQVMQDIKARKQHCRLCFEVLLAKLTKMQAPQWPKELANFSAPLFVTWTYTANQQLRGCIGTFAKQELKNTLPKYALISALNDDRFDAVQPDEVEDLSVAVSFLVNFQENKKALEWQVGRHGIQIFFQNNNRSYSATFLPEVAAEEKWDQTETLKHLVRKAGYRGDYKEVLQKISLTTYESSKASMSYEQYKALIQN